jgi:D-alanyl-D-alanine carboxypeptidase
VIKRLYLSAVIALAFASTCAAEPPKAIVEQVHSRAKQARFDGAILIGEADGSHAVFTVGVNPVRPDAVWRWASITKQLAAVIAMQEVAAGRLDLDTPVARYWPEWKAPFAGKIRIRDLMLHNSGLPQPDKSPADADGVPGFYRASAVSPADAAADFCAGPARAAPPAKYEYNNCDAIVLGEVLARVTGRPFDALVSDRFSGPLGMKRFGMFRFGRPPHEYVHPTGEFSDKDALINFGVSGASAGAYVTIDDLWRFDHALLSGKLLSAAAREQMWQSRRENGFYGFLQWIFPAKLSGCAREMRIVERQGLVGGIELRNYLLPATGQAVILFSRHRPSNFGDPWEGKGFAFDVLSAVVCK